MRNRRVFQVTSALSRATSRRSLQTGDFLAFPIAGRKVAGRLRDVGSASPARREKTPPNIAAAAKIGQLSWVYLALNRFSSSLKPCQTVVWTADVVSRWSSPSLENRENRTEKRTRPAKISISGSARIFRITMARRSLIAARKTPDTSPEYPEPLIGTTMYCFPFTLYQRRSRVAV